MKTPREILLQKHQAAQPKLDRLRHGVLGEAERGCVADQPQKYSNIAAADALRTAALQRPGLKERFTFFPSQLWRELILPSRRIWSGLAAAWVVIILVNLSDSDSLPVASTRMAETTPEARWALAEQRRLIAELIAEPAVEPPAEPLRHYPRPRSDRRMHLKYA